MSFYRLPVLSVFLFLFFLTSSGQTTTSPTFVRVSGEVIKPLSLNITDLEKMKHIDVSQKDKEGNMHGYKGVPITDILEMAGATMGKQLHGENLAKYMLVKCADGYQAVFSLAELDSSFTDRKIVLAYESDGKSLPNSQGPFKLVVPGEKRPARSCMQVNEMVIRSAKE